MCRRVTSARMRSSSGLQASCLTAVMKNPTPPSLPFADASQIPCFISMLSDKLIESIFYPIYFQFRPKSYASVPADRKGRPELSPLLHFTRNPCRAIMMGNMITVKFRTSGERGMLQHGSHVTRARIYGAFDRPCVAGPQLECNVPA